MGKLSKSEQGFSALEVILILVIVGLVGFVGWYVYQSKNKTNATYNNAAQSSGTATKPTPKTSPTTTDPYAGWQTVSGVSMSIKMPQSWVKTDCPPLYIYVSSSKSTAAVCNSGNTGEVIFSQGDTAPDTTFQQYSNDVVTTDITLNNVKGQKVTYTLSSQVPGADFGAKGTKFIEYHFKKSGIYYDAFYRQSAGWPDDSAVFNQIVQSWKF